jgi:predicted dehydrogenase
MSKKLKFGMVGGDLSAFIGKVHRRAALFDDKCEHVAGCFSRNAAKNKATGEAWSIAEDRVYSDFYSMAQKESEREDGIDFVIIAVPNSVHYEASKAFLTRGISVVCDKPFTTTLDEALELALPVL